MRDPSRKHGFYDTRWPAWSAHVAATTPNGALHASERERGFTELGQEPIANGLTWATFSETFYPDRNRHSFPAIAAWSRYRDGDRSWPQGARPRAPSAAGSSS
jgi:hypothetical protein